MPRTRPKAKDGAKSVDVYVVESVLDKRTRGGATEYLVKWKDYPS